MAGMYVPVRGVFHGMHPSIKIACVLGLFVPPLVLNDPIGQAAFLTVLLILTFAARTWQALLRAKALVFGLLVVSLVLWPLFQPGGAVLFAAGPLRITSGGLQFGLVTALKLISFLATALIFLGSTQVEEITWGLCGLRVPYVAAFALSLAFRLAPLFMETGQTIVAAQRSRGLDLDSGSMLKRAGKYGPIIIPIVLSSLRRADGLSVALESRGFRSSATRTSFTQYHIGAREWLCLCGALLFIVASIVERMLCQAL